MVYIKSTTKQNNVKSYFRNTIGNKKSCNLKSILKTSTKLCLVFVGSTGTCEIIIEVGGGEGVEQKMTFIRKV